MIWTNKKLRAKAPRKAKKAFRDLNAPVLMVGGEELKSLLRDAWEKRALKKAEKRGAVKAARKQAAIWS